MTSLIGLGSIASMSVVNLALGEICRTGARYTWTNRQLNPVCCVLDGVLMSADWESLFPLAPWWRTPLLDPTLPSNPRARGGIQETESLFFL
jgi:hypothetical protein